MSIPAAVAAFQVRVCAAAAVASRHRRAVTTARALAAAMLANDADVCASKVRLSAAESRLVAVRASGRTTRERAWRARNEALEDLRRQMAVFVAADEVVRLARLVVRAEQRAAVADSVVYRWAAARHRAWDLPSWV